MIYYEITKHYGWKSVRHCGLIANRRSPANCDFRCVKDDELLLCSLHSKYEFTLPMAVSGMANRVRSVATRKRP